MHLLFYCCLSFNIISAEDSLHTESSNDALVSIDDPEQYTAQIHMLSSIANSSKKIDDYYYFIKEINLPERNIVLENQAKLTIGWWYKNIISDWEAGDRLILYYNYGRVGSLFLNNGLNNGIGIQNIDKDALVWAVFETLPTSENLDCVVKSTHDTKPGYGITHYTITLKSGYQFLMKRILIKDNFPVLVFKDVENDSYIIKDLSLRHWPWMFESTLLMPGNPNWIKELIQH